VFSTPAGCFETKTWRDVGVGDVIIVHKDEYFPADLLFLSAENEVGGSARGGWGGWGL
jgi:phospholipid-translocating ATPase